MKSCKTLLPPPIWSASHSAGNAAETDVSRFAENTTVSDYSTLIMIKKITRVSTQRFTYQQKLTNFWSLRGLKA